MRKRSWFAASAVLMMVNAVLGGFLIHEVSSIVDIYTEIDDDANMRTSRMLEESRIEYYDHWHFICSSIREGDGFVFYSRMDAPSLMVSCLKNVENGHEAFGECIRHEYNVKLGKMTMTLRVDQQGGCNFVEIKDASGRIWIDAEGDGKWHRR